MSLFDLNDVDPQRELVPSGIYQLKAKVRPGSVVDPLCTAKNMRTRHLELELKVIGGNRGEYNGYKIWEYITLDVDETDYSDSELNIKPLSAEQAAKFQTAVNIGRKKLRALVDSAYALNPDDQSEDAKAKRRAVSDDLLTVNGLCFWAQVETRKGTNGYSDKNVVDFIITPGMPDWPKPQEARRELAPRSKDLNDEIPF